MKDTIAEALGGKSRLRPIAYLRQECMAMLKKRSRKGISHRAFSQEFLGAVE